MQKPYIICHMVTSIDGKVTGDFLYKNECEYATEIYYDINRSVKSNGFICGRVTMEGSFTNCFYPELDEYSEIRDREDYVPDNLSGFYAVAFDTNGKLGWTSAHIIDDDPGYNNAQNVEVLSENVDGRYLSYLQTLNIPYIFAGKTKIDVSLALYKLKTLFGAHILLLEGGSIINESFLKADAIDELSLVVAPLVADSDSKPLFYDSTISNFTLNNVDVKNGVLILNYKK